MITVTHGGPVWLQVGWVIALIVLIVAVVFLVIGQLDTKVGGLIIGLALARLL